MSASETVEEQLLVIPKSDIRTLGIEPGLSTERRVLAGLSAALQNGFAMSRGLAEANPDLIQVIPCGVIRHRDRILLLRRRESQREHQLRDKFVVWAGGHIRHDDVSPSRRVEEACLLRELDEELQISTRFSYEPICCVYDTTTPKSAQHLALVFDVQIEGDDLGVNIDQEFQQFRDREGRETSGRLFGLQELAAYHLAQMERWSFLLLTDYFHVVSQKGADIGFASGRSHHCSG